MLVCYWKLNSNGLCSTDVRGPLFPLAFVTAVTRVAAVALDQSLAQKPLHAMGVAKKTTTTTNEQGKNWDG